MAMILPIEKPGVPPETKEPIRSDCMAALVSLIDTGRLGEAERGCLEILDSNPGHDITTHLLGLIAEKRGDKDRALELFLEAVALNPFAPPFHKALGDSWRSRGNATRAIDAYERALRLDPLFVAARAALAKLLLEEKDFERSAKEFKVLLTNDPKNADACLGLASVCIELEQLDSAERLLRIVLRLQPDGPAGYAGIGHVEHKRGNLVAAETAFMQVLARDRTNAAVENNLGAVIKEQGRLKEAMEYFLRAHQTAPADPEPAFNMGCCHWELENIPVAVQWYKKALSIKPDHANSHCNLAMIHFLHGSFSRGWDEYEWRFKAKNSQQPIDTRTFAKPLWDGSPFPGKTLYVRSEQGAGDMIQFCRYMPMVKQLGGRVILECQPKLMRLLGSVSGIDGLVAWSANPDIPFDMYIPLMSLPRFFSRTEGDIPRDVPYLSLPSPAVDKGRQLIASEGLNIGLNWQGNKDFPGDKLRSFPLKHLLPLGNIPGVNLYSLQKGFGAEQIGGVHPECNVIDLGSTIDNGPDAFIETAAAMLNLDLIITSDTSIPHLAGALGRPVWLLLSYRGEWRWLLNREDSPWYPTLRVFRQKQPGDWIEVISRVVAALHEQLLEPNG